MRIYVCVYIYKDNCLNENDNVLWDLYIEVKFMATIARKQEGLC